jgi:hypothetical protein
VLALAGVLWIGLVSQPAEAAVVVLDNGNVLVGRIDPPGSDPDRITIRWADGHAVLDPARVRWLSREADRPTEAYFTAFPVDQFFIDPRFVPAPRAEVELLPLPPLPPTPPGPVRDELSRRWTPCEGGFEARLPLGWSAEVVEGVLMVVRREPGENDFAPRIHLFSAANPSCELLPQTVVELLRITSPQEVLEERSAAGRVDVVTRVPVGTGLVHVMRRFICVEGRVYVFCAFADQVDFPGLEPLFRSCRDSLRPVSQ